MTATQPTPVLPALPQRQTPADERTELARGMLGLSPGEQLSLPGGKAGQTERRLRRLRKVVKGAAAEMQQAHDRAGRRVRVVMVTLTYRPGVEWRPEHISEYVRRLRAWLQRRKEPLRYVWVAELQQRGAVHYHMLVWLPWRQKLPKPDASRQWPHGTTRIETARNPVGYMVKYATKLKSKGGALPRGLRIMGVGGCPRHLGWYRAPGWLQRIADNGHRITKRPGGWHCVQELGTAWRSPWVIVRIGADAIEIGWRGWGHGDVVSLYELDRERALAARAH